MQDELSKRRQDTSTSELKRLLDNQQQRIGRMRRIVQTLDDLGSGIRDPNFSVHHPIDAYRFIKNHSVIYGDAITDLLAEIKLYKDDQEKIDKITNILRPLPSEDLVGTLEGLLRMQEVYDLKTQDIADGNIRNFTKKAMSAAECTDIMVVAFTKLGLNHRAQEWSNIALKLVANGDDTSSYRKILTKGAAVAFKMGEESQAVYIYETLSSLYPQNRYYKYKLKYYKRNVPEKTDMEFVLTNYDTCRGINQKKAANTNGGLLCRYLDNGHPLLRYQPAKLEVLSLNPYISVYHDCIDKNLAGAIKNAARPDIIRSQTPDEKKVDITSKRQTSKGAFFGFTPDVEKLYKYVEALTSLKWKDSYDNMQVVNYGIGGHYNMRQDYNIKSRQSDEVINDRMATFMIYLSDVEEGGATTFPLVGKSVRPEAGKALFWYNLYPDGKGNEQTSHESCPVIIGDKWVATIWIYRNGQEFVRPCNLKQNDTRWKL